MARTTVIGNGNLLVGIDSRGQVRDFYYPYVGHTNHVSGASGSFVHRIGVWVDGTLHWTSHDAWHTSVRRDQEGSVNTLELTNGKLGVVLSITDVVHNEHDVFLRRIVVRNERDTRRLIKVFFGQEFRISESRRGDTAFYDPRVQSILHYKARDTFLVHASIEGESFREYSVGLFGIENKEGTYTDAEDGLLSKNPIEHGSADSVIGLSREIDGKTSATIYYWIAAGKSIHDVHLLHHLVLEETPDRLVTSTENYHRAWLMSGTGNFSCIDKELMYLYRHSLMVIRAHADNRGGIIASSDTDLLNQGRDTYSYVWPRDGAVGAYALDKAGYSNISERFYAFVAKLMEKDGYLMHKYLVDGSLGSSWHPWIQNGVSELPIQEDETASILFFLLRHFDHSRDLEFIESLYNPFIEPAADFLSGYIDHDTGLPAHSYDLWEEKFGTSTYTSASVYGGLTAAAGISALLGKRDSAEKYRTKAEQIKQAILGNLYDVERGYFIKLVRHDKTGLVRDTTLDMSSFYGLVEFGVLDVFDPKIESTVRAVESRLKVPTSYGGFMRYEGDKYYRTGSDAPPNAWCITTLWMAQYRIKRAKSRRELEEAYGILRWIYDRGGESGILPEQIHPYTGAHLSTSPLVWSHAEFVITVHEYVKKFESLK